MVFWLDIIVILKVEVYGVCYIILFYPQYNFQLYCYASSCTLCLQVCSNIFPFLRFWENHRGLSQMSILWTYGMISSGLNHVKAARVTDHKGLNWTKLTDKPRDYINKMNVDPQTDILGTCLQVCKSSEVQTIGFSQDDFI